MANKRKRSSEDMEHEEAEYAVPKSYKEMVLNEIKGDIVQKLEKSEPYRLFCNYTPAGTDMDLSLSLAELLSPKLGNISRSLHMNFCVDTGWFRSQYEIMGKWNTPITLIYGEAQDLEEYTKKHKNFVAIKKTMNSYAHHHTKLMVFLYEDKSMRIVIGTANLMRDDWYGKLNGFWVSPKLPFVQGSLMGKFSYDCKTGFKREFCNYLLQYEENALNDWLFYIYQCDFSNINVFLLSSVPSVARNAASSSSYYGYTQLGDILKKNEILGRKEITKEPFHYVYQSSSIGALGKDTEWLQQKFTACIKHKDKNPAKLHIIYPAYADTINVFSSFNVMYMMRNHEKQTWIERFLNRWRSETRGRTGDFPHIKSYGKFTPCWKYANWFVLTSANISKAAWGNTDKEENLKISNWELGVLFLPKFVVNEEKFCICKGEAEKTKYAPFPIHYDVPPSNYRKNDKPTFREDFR